MSSRPLPVLALNCGSSSLKFGVYSTGAKGGSILSDLTNSDLGNQVNSIQEGEAEEIGHSGATPDHATALRQTLESLEQGGLKEFSAVGHRLVHGGPHLREHARLTAEVSQKLQAAVEFAPLHLPAALAVIDAIEKKLPGIPQVICLDTAFHRHMPDVAKTLALPADVRALGVERFGFHGLSLESILAQLHPVPHRLVVAHLGNGSSITAIRNGQSIDTSMGLTPTGGVMMGTRCGDLDPGAILYLMRHLPAGADKLQDLVDHKSGLLGISSKASDVRELLAARASDPQADLALRMFCYQVRKTVASMAAALGGLDALVFTGGIGEHAHPVRDEICRGLAFLGPHTTQVLPAQEDLQIARITSRLCPAEAAACPA
ncbi:MAG TPA: acetate/propionate family kinase [Bryobacteraceae bacterium]|nr:acetate/propionate family kinase [Bryobacteraceae bacterium]